MALIPHAQNPVPWVPDTWTPLDFGKYAGKTLPQVIFDDPDWFFHAYDNGFFKDKENLRAEAKAVYERATSIRIPPAETERMVVEYRFDHQSHKFSNIEIMPADHAPQSGATLTERSDRFDLSYLRGKKEYNKSGYANFLSSMKACLFGDASYRMTKARCEEFFSDNERFIFRRPSSA